MCLWKRYWTIRCFIPCKVSVCFFKDLRYKKKDIYINATLLRLCNLVYSCVTSSQLSQCSTHSGFQCFGGSRIHLLYKWYTKLVVNIEFGWIWHRQQWGVMKSWNVNFDTLPSKPPPVVLSASSPFGASFELSTWQPQHGPQIPQHRDRTWHSRCTNHARCCS